MAIHRKRFRVEEAIVGEMPSPEMIEEAAPMHSEIMAELRAIRTQMAKGTAPLSGSAAMAAIDASTAHELSEARTMLDTYRAQIEQCEKLKVELDLIHDAIDRTKREIATLHGKSFDGGEMAKVNGELGAVVGGTEQATQQILEAAESIDQAASAMAKVQSADQQKRLADDIQERVISIFEACNFQDLTGQRISKVMSTMKFIEQHINSMMENLGRRRRDQVPRRAAGRHPQR
ncbi:chemotaxis protein CheZ [Bradyrhizobium sp. GM7.3]